MNPRGPLLAALVSFGLAAPIAVASPPEGRCHDHSHGHGHGHGHGHEHHGHCGDDGGGGSGGGTGGGTGGGSGGGSGGGTGGGSGAGPGGAAGSPSGAGGTTGSGVAAGTGTPGANGGLGVTQVADVIAPVLSLPRLSPATFRAARRGASIASVPVGTRLTYTLSEPARVRFTVQKRRHLSRVCRQQVARRSRHRTGTRCRRWISLRGSFANASAAGNTKLRFRGRLRGRALRPGSYRLVATATDAAGNRSTPLRPTFRIVR